MNIDLLDLQPHLTHVKIRTDEYGRICLRAAGRDLTLGVAQHAARPEHSILGLSVLSNVEHAREIFVCADEWIVKLADVAAAVTKPTSVIWIGAARARHGELVRELDTARELGAVAAARAWSGSELRDADADTLVVSEGDGRLRATLQLSAAVGHEIRLVASLGRFELFTCACTVREAPAVGVEAVRVLRQGERLAESDALQAQRAVQTAFAEQNGLAEFPSSIWAATRRAPAVDSGTLFEKLKAGSLTAKPAPVVPSKVHEALAALMASSEVPS